MNNLNVSKILSIITLLMMFMGLILSFVSVSINDEALDYFDKYYSAELDSAYESEMYNKYLEKIDNYETFILLIGFCYYIMLAFMIATTALILTVKEKQEDNILNYNPQVKTTNVTICWNCKHEFPYIPNPYGIKQVTCPKCGQIGIISKES